MIGLFTDHRWVLGASTCSPWGGPISGTTTAAGGRPARHLAAFYDRVWREAAAHLGATYTPLGSGIAEILLGGIQTRVVGNTCPIDDPVTLAIASNRPLTYQLLARDGLTIPRYAEFTLKDDRSGDRLHGVEPPRVRGQAGERDRGGTWRHHRHPPPLPPGAGRGRRRRLRRRPPDRGAAGGGQLPPALPRRRAPGRVRPQASHRRRRRPFDRPPARAASPTPNGSGTASACPRSSSRSTWTCGGPWRSSGSRSAPSPPTGTVVTLEDRRQRELRSRQHHGDRPALRLDHRGRRAGRRRPRGAARRRRRRHPRSRRPARRVGRSDPRGQHDARLLLPLPQARRCLSGRRPRPPETPGRSPIRRTGWSPRG